MAGGRQIEHTPEESTLILSISVFIRMRWFAILGVLVAAIVAHYVLKIIFPIVPVYIISGLMIVYNIVLWRQLQGARRLKAELLVPAARRYGYIHITLDLVALAVLLHFTGGIENPFIFFFVFHVIGASIMLNYRAVYLLSTVAILLVLCLVFLEYNGILDHYNLEGYAEPLLYRHLSYIIGIMAALVTILYTSTYIATAVVGELRKRQREVVLLRDSLIEQRNTELRQAATEIDKLAEERSRFLRFIGIAAHDLKAPLTAIQGFLWVMLGGFSGPVNEKQKDMLQRSANRILELLSLISDLLDIPRIESGQLIQDMKETSLPQVIKESIEEQRNLAKEKGLKIKTKVPANLPVVKGSAPRLRQVMTNLLNNAIRYSSEGEITVEALEEGDNIVVKVSDTGIGIPCEDIPRMFEDFFRASNVETKGTGLGLSISRRIIEAHGGKIWVNSPCPATGMGSLFTFSIPKLS